MNEQKVNEIILTVDCSFPDLRYLGIVISKEHFFKIDALCGAERGAVT